MGLVKEGDDYVILTDIQGAEDHLGDMDFKVAGSRDGITALQMDIKITGVTQEIMRDALEQAKRAREFILDKMLEVDPGVRARSSPTNAPRITTIKIDQEKIGMVIGKGGETIRALESDYEVQIDIEEDGTILIYATEGTKADAAIAAIEALTKEPGGRRHVHRQGRQDDPVRRLRRAEEGHRRAAARLERRPGPGRAHRGRDGRGDVVDVIVQEVDKARGRIGLKLIAKHENGGLVQPEELIERAKDAPPRPREEERPRGGDRVAAAEAGAAGASRAAPSMNRRRAGETPPSAFPGSSTPVRPAEFRFHAFEPTIEVVGGVRTVFCLALVAAIAAPATVASARAKPVRTLTVAPRAQYVTLPVRVKGAHWVVNRACPDPVRVTIRKPTGKALTVRSVRLKADGSFALRWTIPRLLGGLTLRVRAVETCRSKVRGQRIFERATTLRVLGTP